MSLTNPITEPQIPQAIARDTEFAAADAAHVASANPHPQYLAVNPPSIEMGIANVNFLDFHLTPPPGVDPSTVDFDARLIVSEGIGQNGKAKVALQASVFDVLARVSVNTGSQLSRLLSTSVTLDLPSISSGARSHLDVTLAGAQPGDVAFFLPTTDLNTSGLWCFNIQSVVVTTGSVRIYFHNLFSTALDIAPFSGRLLVIGFASQ
jgi:hypothetical protein